MSTFLFIKLNQWCKFMLFHLKSLPLLFPILFLAVISCTKPLEPETVLPPPEMPDSEIFNLDFTGITSNPSGAKQPGYLDWIPAEMIDFDLQKALDDPFSLALAFIADYRRGMVNQLRSIFFSTFQNVNELTPELVDEQYIWNFRSNIYDPDMGMPMIWSDLKLVAMRVAEGNVDWRLYRVTEGEEVFVAVGHTSRSNRLGNWIFFFHDGMQMPAFSFSWERKNGQTAKLYSDLHFVNVSTSYLHNGDWIIHTQERSETVENTLFADVRWSRRTGEGTLFISSYSLPEGITLCWDSYRVPLNECSH